MAEELARCETRRAMEAAPLWRGRINGLFPARDIVEVGNRNWRWFLYCHRPAVVLTTAPTWRQVESLLWEEIRRRFHRVQARAEADPSRPRLEGSLLQTRLKVADGHFAMGLSTDEPVRFQGFHAENLLVVLDEACGVPEEIWDAIEGVCVGRNNRVLAISNPLSPAGRFYQLFKSPRWKTFTLSALAHPNVAGETFLFPVIPGAVTREAVADRIADWCEPMGTAEANVDDRETFAWEGRRYRPNGLFRARVQGEFPEAAADSLIALSWIETVLAVRQGDTVTRLATYRGLSTMEVAGRIAALAQEEHAEVIAVDAVGIGAGVVDRLEELGVAGLVPVQFGERPVGAREADQFLNLRAQTYWALRDRFRSGQIRLPQDETLAAQLASLRYQF